MVAVSDVFYEEQSVEDERLERIVSIMNSLPTMQQTIVRLRHMEGMEMRQIAELTGSSEVAVRKALSRARKAIKEQFLNHKN
jgi:RNA polymerase sigma-70 factor (ECF subfamily)